MLSLTKFQTSGHQSYIFFDESSVVKTTRNRKYGSAVLGEPAIEVQRYARFFRVPRVIVNQGEYTGELTSERRRM